MPKRVLITGGNGYIGKHVVKAVLEIGAEVTVCDLRTDEVDKRAKTINHDLFLLGKDVYHKLEKPDICLHMAWQDGFSHNAQCHMENLSRHYMFIKNMLDGGLKHLAIMGTMHEVGYHEGSVDETTVCNPRSMYGIAKDALRRSTLHMMQESNALVQWLRVFYVYGDDSRNRSVFTKLIQAEQDGKKKFPFNSGKNKYDFIHIDVLAKQIAAAITQDTEKGIINCCTGHAVSIGEKVESFIEEHGMKIQLGYGTFPDRPYDSPAIWGDNKKIQRIMSKSSFSLE